MSNTSEKIIKTLRSVLPSPLTIAILLTVLTFLLAIFLTKTPFLSLAEYWEKGFLGFDLKENNWVRSWQLPFIIQMMLMLVLGYILALSKPVNNLISYFTQYCTTNAKAAFIVTLSTLLVSFFNWGLGLIFGAIFARKVAEFAVKNGIKLNYGLIGAAGYSGLMVWHGGLSGSAPVKAAEKGNLAKLLPNYNNQIPDSISLDETIFSSMNITVTICLLIILPLAMYWMGKKVKTKKVKLTNSNTSKDKTTDIIGAEKLDHLRIFSLTIGLLVLTYCFYLSAIKPPTFNLKFLTPDFINLALLGLAFTFHKSIYHFLKALDNAIGSSSGILIQFPFYFGILGIMKYSGLMELMSNFFVEISTQNTFALYTFFSAGIVNFFVPSGGGQWAVQGPIILEAANNLGLSLPKSIMAIAYGDELTNMLQPFWALPLLGITGLKAKDVLPYTLFLMFIGAIVFILGLIIF